MAENLELRHSEFSERLCNMTGCSIQETNKEVDMTIQRLFYWGAYADKYGGTVQVKLIPVLQTVNRDNWGCNEWVKNDDFANKTQFELKSYVMIVDEKSWQFS